MEVTCSYSDAVNEGDSEVTCTSGTDFTFSKEPRCSIQGLLISLNKGVGGGGKATMIFPPFGLRPGVMVIGSKFFDHEHGQNFKITMVKLSLYGSV